MTDALSIVARVVGRVAVRPLDGAGLEEALAENRKTPDLEQVQFREDFPRWARAQTRRNRKAIHFFMTGHRTEEVARKVGLSSSRVSQLIPNGTHTKSG